MKCYLKIILLFVFLSSCLKDPYLSREVAENVGNDFHIALANGYNSLAQEEKQEFDWNDADIFAKKGLKASKGLVVLVDSPEDREVLDKFVKEDLIEAFNNMNDLFYRCNIAYNFPLKAARLQILYEYWLEQGEEDWQKKDIYKYREEFLETYRNIEVLACRKKVEIDKKDRNHYIILFDHDKSSIDKQARNLLNQVIYYLHHLGYYDLVLTGHTDYTGGEGYNYKLAEKRLSAVENYLSKNGISQNRVTRKKSFGKDKPLLSKKALGERDRLNRRVEIYVIK